MAGGDESLMKALEQGISPCGAVVVCDLVVRVAELQALAPIYDHDIQRARLKTILWDFPKRRNYSRGSGDTLRFPKIKVSSCQNHPTRPETGKNKKPIKTERFPKMSSLEGNEGNMGEIMGNMTG